MSFVENEHTILKFWKEKEIFEKLRKKIEGKEPWSFVDGPITANNPMGVHHAWGRTLKDLLQRYHAMMGHDVRFQNGFDCQGLWVEVEVEKELGFKNKKDIEEYGVDKFVEKCKERVIKYSGIQRDQSIRLGQMMDWDNSYFTMAEENNYAIWHFLKTCHEKELLHKGKDVVPWCSRCGTAISQHEILTEEYKELTHTSVFVKIKSKDFNFLVWTTTPWTLPGNVMLAVNPEMDYVKVKKDEEVYVLAKSKADLVDGKIIGEIKGKELEGIEYVGMFDELDAVDVKHSVILWDDVTEEEGTGIVHIAPGCGEEDYKLSKELNFDVINLTNNESEYNEGFGEYSGKSVMNIKDEIFKSLEEKGLLYKTEEYTHRYPTCWRCKSELIFRLVDEWYIKMDPLRKPLSDSVNEITWIPGFGKDRELDWLRNMKDWLISKKRYWGLALPIFECECGSFEVVGSYEELKEKAVEGWDKFEGNTPHKPWIDEVKVKCSKCDNVISRIPDVGNPWLDAGIVPFSTINEENKNSVNTSKKEVPSYFRDKEYWEKWFPMEVVCESFPGQFKNWFYSLLVMSQVLENKPPFKTLYGYASVVDEKGEEMHKSKGNAIWFDDAAEEIGADVMRWMYVKQRPVGNMRFGFNIAKETERKLLTLSNSYRFFHTYLDKENLKEDNSLLDEWIVSRFNSLLLNIEGKMKEYSIDKATEMIEHFFIEDLSLWYIRRSRKRFQEGNGGVFYDILKDLSIVISPFMPFMGEKLYQDLRTENDPESVVLCDYLKSDKSKINTELEEQMQKAREMVGDALSLRTELGIKIKQPLQSVSIPEELPNEVLDTIKEELNVKEVKIEKGDIKFDTKMSPELIEEGQLREVIRHIQDLRKKGKLTPSDKVKLMYGNFPVIDKYKDHIMTETRLSEISKGEEGEFIAKKNAKIGDLEIFLGIL